MRSYCVPDRAALLPQDYSPAVKPTSSLEFLVLTLSIEYYAHLSLLFKWYVLMKTASKYYA